MRGSSQMWALPVGTVPVSLVLTVLWTHLLCPLGPCGLCPRIEGEWDVDRWLLCGPRTVMWRRHRMPSVAASVSGRHPHPLGQQRESNRDRERDQREREGERRGGMDRGGAEQGEGEGCGDGGVPSGGKRTAWPRLRRARRLGSWVAVP